MPRTHATHSVALAALAAELPAAAAPSELRLIPAGNFRGIDGRPENLPHWSLDAAQAATLIAAAKARQTKYVIDYEHQTLRAEANGQAAPASGWFSQLEWRDGAQPGLWATDVKWTARAAAMIEAGEYRYISPVFAFDQKTGAVKALASAALVNTPGLDGLTDLSTCAALSALFDLPAEKDAPMKTLLAALGLALTASEDDAVNAINALKAQHAAHGNEIAALKAQTGAAPDPAKYVEVAVMKAVHDERNELKAKLQDIEVGQVVTVALSDGRLQPAQRAWAESLGKTNLVALKEFIAATAPGIVPGQTQTGGNAPSGVGGSGSLDADGLAVCKALGLTPEEFNKGKKD